MTIIKTKKHLELNLLILKKNFCRRVKEIKSNWLVMSEDVNADFGVVLLSSMRSGAI